MAHGLPIRGSLGLARSNDRAITEPEEVRWLLIGVAVVFLGLFLFMPLAAVFVQAFEQGWLVYLQSLADPDALAAIRLTLITAAIAVPLNVVFGVAAAWCIAKFEFVGKSLLITLIDLPFAVSPVIAGLIYVVIFGREGWLWGVLAANDRAFGLSVPGVGAAPALLSIPLRHVQIIFALPGVVIATLFVTFPFVARELIPVMHAQGREEEEAARVLGAGGWQIFRRVTLPNIKWGLLYGVILCNARAMGEFGAVSVVSGHIRGLTNTMPLHVEILYNEYQFSAAFAVASLLALLAIVTLVLKSILEWKTAGSLAPVGEEPQGEDRP